jgi:hypothetical protein
MHQQFRGVWENVTLYGQPVTPQNQLSNIWLSFDGFHVRGITYDLAWEEHDVVIFPDLFLIVTKYHTDGCAVELYGSILPVIAFEWNISGSNGACNVPLGYEESRGWLRVG